ncbi:MAG: hypothetical protein L0177_06185 [Chloroflexi bacterium]|nr:hypothetical protein [Chloroflexota bacterium]
MPRKRIIAKGRLRLTLQDIGFANELSWCSGWHPPLGEFEASRSRWQGWAEFFEEYEQVRDEFLAEGLGLGSEWRRRGNEPFAEEQYQAWLAAGRPDEWETEGEREARESWEKMRAAVANRRAI